jgi:hypothetical protein
MRINVGHGVTAEIDDADATLAAGYSWHLKKRRNGRQYVATSVRTDGNPTTVYLHRLLLGFPKGHVDHEDGDTLNNKRSNLRRATVAQNGANTLNWTGAKSSRFKGVYLRKDTGRWEARIGSRPKLNLGSFDSEEEAARAYDAAKRERYGEFAKTNLPVVRT